MQHQHLPHQSLVPNVRDVKGAPAHIVSLRRELHRIPELAFQEALTAEVVRRELDRLGIPYTYGGVGTGIVGRLECGPGPSVALRAEMDALPGEETTGLPFASEHPCCVHACGHDAHMAMVLGAAERLSRNPPAVGTVLFAFQPAEERGGGARVVLDSGALDDVDAVFAGHVTHHYGVGEIMVASGVITAQSDRFCIHVLGRGGHGARPHLTSDAVVVAGLLITALQTLVSRQMDPVHPSVVTIGKVLAGTAPNVIAETATLEGTFRTTLPQARERLIDGLRRTASAIGAAYGAEIEVEINAGYPPVVNTEAEAAMARRAAVAVVGEQGVARMDYPSMGSEDFSFMLQRIPGAYVRFGARLAEDGYIPLHSPRFDIDERVLEIGAGWFEAVARDALDTLADRRPDEKQPP